MPYAYGACARAHSAALVLTSRVCYLTEATATKTRIESFRSMEMQRYQPFLVSFSHAAVTRPPDLASLDGDRVPFFPRIRRSGCHEALFCLLVAMRILISPTLCVTFNAVRGRIFS